MKKEVLLFIALILASVFPLMPAILGDTLETVVSVANVAPYILRSEMYVFVNVGDDDNGYMSLSENSTVQVTCNGTIHDANGQSDISSLSGTLYDAGASNHADSDDNNKHYTNSSCVLFSGSGTTRGGECQFTVWYYANNATWQCNLSAVDSGSNENSTYKNRTIAKLIALMVPPDINFGNLNPGDTSGVNKTNITNSGNVDLGIKVYGYANNATTSPNAMNCTAGQDKNISLFYMHYNVTNPSCTGFSWTANYANLTNETNEVSWDSINLYQRQNDNIESKNTTCWVLKIPSGTEADVSGTCKGIISFTACEDGTC
ncbi:hypothetical protein B6U80_01510 [Candidatus Pacearchaeota archaeon ex4484_26]|nr:MAG: hypothetical protein B6U80_01510 [Candidatus Pacearchaeota archaeon ex4484_26]